MGRSAVALSTETMSAGSGVVSPYQPCGGASIPPVSLPGYRPIQPGRSCGTMLSESPVCPICGCPITVTRLVR